MNELFCQSTSNPSANSHKILTIKRLAVGSVHQGLSVMQKYQAFLNGTNFWLKDSGKIKSFGYYQTIYVEAEDTEEAEDKAIDISIMGLREKIQNPDSEPLVVQVSKVIPVQQFPEGEINEGRTFYIEKKWWQFWK
jgi:hypothetical protein